MSFYVGCYLILSDTIAPKHDHDNWELPDVYGHQGHMSDTSNVEELLIDPEDMDLIPTQIQFGCATYDADEGFTPIDTFAEFYSKDEKFYVRSFTPTDYFVEFYTADEHFYVRDFTPRFRYWTEFYTGSDSFSEFYMSEDTFAEFYVKTEYFYVHNFTATDYWAEFYVPSC